MGAKRNTPPPPLSHQAERAARFEAHRVGGLVEAWEQQVGLPPRRKLHPSKSVGSLQRPQSAGPGRARRPRSAGVRTRGGGGQVIIERSESSLPPNGARAAESRVQERLAKIRSSGAELAELERRVSSYRKGRPTGDGVYHVTQNMDPVILRRKRPQTVHAVSREHNDKYRAERELVLARRDAERTRQMEEHIASRDRQELKRQAMKEARLLARQIKLEKSALVGCALASRVEVVRAEIERVRLSRIMEAGRDKAIRKLQSAWRTIRTQKSEALLGDAARVIQRGVRMFLWRATLQRKCRAASKIIEYANLCGGAGGFVQMLQTYRSRVIFIQRMWKKRRLTHAAIVIALTNHWDRAKKAVAVERATLSEAAVMLKRSGKLTPELEEQVTVLLPSLAAVPPASANTNASEGEKAAGTAAAIGGAAANYPTKSLKDRRKEERKEDLASKHAMLGKIEEQMKKLPQFATGKEVPLKQRRAAIERYVVKSQAAHRAELRKFYVAWTEYEELMVGVERQLATRRALGARLDIERPPRPAKPRWKIVPRKEAMWAVILDTEKRAKKGGARR